MSTTRRPWFPPRLADVAARAGTSKAIASRALGRGHPSPFPTLRRVQEAAQDLGYRPPTDRAHLLVLSTDISRTGYWATVSGVVAASEELGADLSIHVLSGGSQRRREILSRALDGRVDGVVLLEFDSVSVAALEDLPVDLPVAIAGGRPGAGHEEPPRAWTDDYAGAMTATHHLCDLGHERLAYVGVPSAGHPDPRLAGWRRVLAQRHLRASEPVAIGWSVETGLRSAAAVRASRATGILCGNDDLAIGLVAGLAREGVEVPRDVSVVGVDDHPHAVGMVPALTTVRLDFAGVGEAAARLALGIEVGPVVEVPSQLVVRDSTAPPA